ncbi:(Fe-S)-binding protein [Thiorhodococcus mannitoliphagus]|uniref:(Fe-S)-binding protein n=1 Tax=Thiorhodococcus mannitoliphagus TaxID=329406 RepID=A0A6P1E0J9_9GAMM|nr:(Fe-S)-binding protein [Thiorhodococcus mannitoliphagus]NEX21982.1 (Fe-S)-binding protein [Thiorhodococcus mannitoliphagus]
MSKPERVLFFGTCLVDLNNPEAGLAAMRLIQKAGVQVRFPQGQTCCGQPAYNAGYRDEARRVARLQIEALQGSEPVVVPSASCAGMMRNHYPRLFEGTPDAPRAKDLANRVVELCDFLDRVLAIELADHGPPLRVAVHHSCSARREMGVADSAAALLRRLENITVVEPDHAEECCGFGGTFALKEPEISAAMATDKASAIAATAAPILVSQDCGCLMNIGGTAEKAGFELKTMHIAELLWERTGKDV